MVPDLSRSRVPIIVEFFVWEAGSPPAAGENTHTWPKITGNESPRWNRPSTVARSRSRSRMMMNRGGSRADANARYPEWSARRPIQFPYRGSSFAPWRAARESAWLQVSVEPSRRICRSSWRWNPPTTTLFPPTSPTGFSLDEEPARDGCCRTRSAHRAREENEQRRRRETGQSAGERRYLCAYFFRYLDEGRMRATKDLDEIRSFVDLEIWERFSLRFHRSNQGLLTLLDERF